MDTCVGHVCRIQKQRVLRLNAQPSGAKIAGQKQRVLRLNAQPSGVKIAGLRTV